MYVNLADKNGLVYARYSSANQREASIEDQVRRCRTFVEQHGGDMSRVEVLSDYAMSGTSTQRPAFERLMQLVEAGKVQFIVTEDMSRISRDFADSASIFKKLEYLRVPLIGVADGIDTSATGAKFMFSMRALMNDAYIDQLRDKTLRGLEGRALAGFSTGGLPTGFKSAPVTDAAGKVTGHRVLVDEARAALVRRIFEMYRDGHSYSAIAKQLNFEHVPPPRKWKCRTSGWTPETVRAILYNRAYLGEFTFKQKQWRKVPNTNKRRPIARPREEVIARVYEDRRVIDQQLWDEVHARLAAINACYTKNSDGSPKGRVVSGKQNNYLLSGLLRCGVCGSPMTIHAGTSARYYRCPAQKKRGTCVNSLPLREDVARARVVEVALGRLRSTAGLDRMRRRIATRLGELSRTANSELRERRERLARLEEKITGLIELQINDRSEYLASMRKDHEAHAAVEKRAIASLVERAEQPVELPPPSFFLERADRLADLFENHPLQGREALQRMFFDGQLRVVPQLDGYYMAEGRYSELRVLSLPLGPETTKAPRWRGFRGDLWSRDGCAGAIRPISTEPGAPDVIPWRFVVARPVDRRKLPETWRRRAAGNG